MARDLAYQKNSTFPATKMRNFWLSMLMIKKRLARAMSDSSLISKVDLSSSAKMRPSISHGKSR